MRSIREVMKGNLLIFTLGDVLRQLSMFIPFPFFSLYVLALGGSIVDIGIVNSLRALSGLLIYPIAGYISDRYSRVKIIVATVYFVSPIWLLYAFAWDWRALAAANFVQGFMTFYFPASNSLMADSIEPEKRGLGFSLWIAIPSIVGIFSPYLGGYLTTEYGVIPAMRFLYLLSFFVALITGTMNLKFLKEPPRKNDNRSRGNIIRILVDSYKDMFNVLVWLPRSLKAFSVMLVLSFFFNSMTSSYWVLYCVEVLGLSKLQWGSVLLIATVVNVVLLLPAGMIVDRFGPKRTLTIALAVSSIPLILFPFSRGFLDVAVLFVIMTISNSVLISGAPTFMAQAVPNEMRGRVMATLGQGMLFINTRGGGGGGPGMGAILTIPSIVGAMIGGFIYEYNPIIPWVLMGGSMLVSAFINAFYVSEN